MRKMILVVMLTSAFNANAFDIIDSTYLVGIQQGSPLTLKAQSLGSGGFETATGSSVKFDKWYTSKFVDMKFDFMTKVNNEFGILWGFSTGEKAEKYKIEPSFKLGAVAISQISKNANITLSGYYTFGGRLKEKSCTADYGDIGGVQEVNCRLAATELQPAETLQYLINERPYNYKVVNIQFKFQF